MSWTRSELKERAKVLIKKNYWTAFLVSLVIIITGGSHNHNAMGGTGGAGTNGGGYIDFRIAAAVGSIVLLIIVLRILIGYVLEVGGRKFYIRYSRGDSNLGYLGYGFIKGRYRNILITMLLRSIYTFLWTLLFVIPGIVKFYAYRMVPYILADNPEISNSRAIELSNKMTRGEKWEIFIMDLSFFGWYILGALAFGIGVFFVQPYYDTTQAELYLILRKKAMANGITTKEELKI